MPAILEDLVRKLRKQGKPKQQAWAIGISALQKAGILKKGSKDRLTKKGRRRNRKYIRG